MKNKGGSSDSKPVRRDIPEAATADATSRKRRPNALLGGMLRPGVPANMPRKRQAVGASVSPTSSEPLSAPQSSLASAAPLPAPPTDAPAVSDASTDPPSKGKKKLRIGGGPVKKRRSPSHPEEPDTALEALAGFDPKEVMREYLAGNHGKALGMCYEVLNTCTRTTLVDVTSEDEDLINQFVETVLYLLTRPDLIVNRKQAYVLLACQHTMSNLVALSVFKTTDAHLAIIGRHRRNFGKILFLYTALNRQYIDPRQFFDADPRMASLWYAGYALGAPTAASQRVWENKQRHFAYVDDRLEASDTRINSIFFDATYINDDDARRMKLRLNADIQRQIGDTGPKITPVRDHIAIVSAKWSQGTAVHRSLSPLVYSLKDKYHLTLVHFGPYTDRSETDAFDDVREISLSGSTIDCTQISKSDFQLVFYPDIGMSPESIWLSNMRLAPIQCVGYGHPTTTGGSLIDYFIGGAEVELAEKAQNFYTERLVLIPGLGAVPVYPPYDPQYPERDTDTIYINLAWGSTKINYPMLCRLKAIVDRSPRPVFFRFFPGSGASRYSSLKTLLREMGELLGKRATVFSERVFGEYMAERERGHFALDSYPFGGYNTVVDALHIGNPVVTHEGDRFYNRASSALLRRVGLEELIAHSDEEYIEKAVRLVNDDDYRESLREHLRNTDLKACLYEDGNAQYFCKAIDYLIENHERLQREGSREPIFIT